MIEAKVIADSISTENKRITTLQLVYPRMIHAELMTHRVFSRNAGSSRAVPVAKMADMAINELVEPMYWGKNQPGMQAMADSLEGTDLEEAKHIWNDMAQVCARGVKRLGELGLHKQWANRPLEWFSNIRVLLTATEFDNWDSLRIHADAQPEIYELAKAMRSARENSTPELLVPGEWHLPYISKDEKNDSFFHIPANHNMLRKISAARCCRVSYLKHDGTVPNIDDDLALFQRLAGAVPFHSSPLEHQATPDTLEAYGHFTNHNLHGNLVGWVQFRKLFEDQHYGNIVT